MVLLMQARGLSVASIGWLMAVYGITTAALELPTGGLADVFSRRAVLTASSCVGAVGTLLLGLSTQVVGIAAALFLLGAARALGSGPLESWYVDTVRKDDEQASITAGISRAQAAEALSLGVGAVIGGLLPAVSANVWPLSGAPTSTPLIALSVPFLVAAAMLVAHAIAVMALITRDRPAHTPRESRPTVLSTVSSGLRIAGSHRGLRLVLAYTGLLGILLAGVELISPGTIAGLLEVPSQGSAAYGILVSAAFGASALGAMLSPRVALRFSSQPRAAGLVTAVAAVCVLAIAVPTLGAAGSAFILVYLLLGVTGPMAAELIHDRVGPAERSTILSIESLVLQLGGVVSSIVVGGLVARAGTAAGYALLAFVLLVAAALIRRVPVTSPDLE
jgi:MFS family permease